VVCNSKQTQTSADYTILKSTIEEKSFNRYSPYQNWNS